MKINILQGKEGAKQAKGMAVVIDVFRAFSTACYAFDQGANKIIPVSSLERSFELQKQNPAYLLAGERGEQKVEGFDFGNSPTQISKADLKGRTLVQNTSAGTQGVILTSHLKHTIVGSFVNAEAIVRYIKFHDFKEVSFICMGYEGDSPSDEDTFLAEYIAARLDGNTLNFQNMIETLRIGSGARLLDPKNAEWSPASDFDLCLALDRFDFVLEVHREMSDPYLSKVII